MENRYFEATNPKNNKDIYKKFERLTKRNETRGKLAEAGFDCILGEHWVITPSGETDLSLLYFYEQESSAIFVSESHTPPITLRFGQGKSIKNTVSSLEDFLEFSLTDVTDKYQLS